MASDGKGPSRANRRFTQLLGRWSELTAGLMKEQASFWGSVYDGAARGEFDADRWSKDAARAWAMAATSAGRMAEFFGAGAAEPSSGIQTLFVLLDESAEGADPVEFPLPEFARGGRLEIRWLCDAERAARMHSRVRIEPYEEATHARVKLSGASMIPRGVTSGLICLLKGRPRPLAMLHVLREAPTGGGGGDGGDTETS